VRLEDIPEAREIVISAHEAAHAVASVRLGLPFDYVGMDHPEHGPHVMHMENWPNPIPFYCGGTCCGPNRPMCDACKAEERRAEAYMMVAVCGSIGVRATGCTIFGYGNDADRALLVEFCQVAFNDRTEEEINARIRAISDRAVDLMRPEGPTTSAVARELRTRRRLTEAEVKQTMQIAELG
jgi:hypothetical protein